MNAPHIRDNNTYWKFPADILEEDKITLGLDAAFIIQKDNKAYVLFMSEDDMNYYKLSGRLREGIDCYFRVDKYHFER